MKPFDTWKCHICGEIKYTDCPLCGEKVKLTCGRDWKFHGNCPSCGKEILE